MFGLLVRRVGILCPIVILVIFAGVVGTAIVDTRRLFQLRVHERSKGSTAFCVVADSGTFAKIIAWFSLADMGRLTGGKKDAAISYRNGNPLSEDCAF